jgi:hypothetical protein
MKRWTCTDKPSGPGESLKLWILGNRPLISHSLGGYTGQANGRFRFFGTASGIQLVFHLQIAGSVVSGVQQGVGLETATLWLIMLRRQT